MSEERQQHWEEAYQGKAESEVSWYQEYPDISLQLIDRSGIGMNAPLIDVGGGTSVLIDNLLLKGYSRVAVLDISSAALECTRQRLADKAEQVEWLVSDVTRFQPSHTFSLWHDRAVFHFLTDTEDRRRYIDVLKSALRQGGYLVLATFALDGPEQCSGLPVERYDADKMQAVLGEEFTLQESRREVHVTPAGGEQRFSYALFRYQS
ncbi:MAG: class I SAM-dependent methyltransferase [Candidatus Thiodiazotropha sp.]